MLLPKRNTLVAETGVAWGVQKLFVGAQQAVSGRIAARQPLAGVQQAVFNRIAARKPLAGAQPAVSGRIGARN
ncbi:MAG: hypothetical protein GX483_02695 [Actinomycetaceae bacterium]|nr:hypothetical protein [Actinomycetaceae bacterium]